MRVAEAFQISGRGNAVTVDQTTDLPVAKTLTARLTRPDGTVVVADAHKEWLLRRSTSEAEEKEAFLLRGLDTSDVPLGSDLHLELPGPFEP
jgi:hypothetical protein